MNGVSAILTLMLGVPETTVLPSQIDRGCPIDPTRNLMAAILEDALRCLNGTAYGSRQRRALAEEAERWIFSEADDGYFSFVSVCACLGMAPGRLRERLHPKSANGYAALRWSRSSPTAPTLPLSEWRG